ncbi:type II restriction enzyme [Reichenbachiella faecimaris]|uniref:Type II restriction enzyme n=1 Tax=Reichenbachiella faecimaris TaxID=692418 RepID=A0A1W2G754_REIFA|nr:restriction endonuclease [Reichenbachiella faecimaris]SMD32497.1 type II restriction enzyme [Reichenbachiella faecimaris]
MRKLSASNLVAFINQLEKNTVYNYINPRTKGVIKVEGIDLPEGPIRIKRWEPAKGQSENDKSVEHISTEMIWRVANAFNPSAPINLDRVLGGSYNTRSVLEALLAYTPEFYFCYPGRIENKGGQTSIKHGHKHLLWRPDSPHRLGILEKAETEIVISEMPALDAFYDSLVLPSDQIEEQELDIEVLRRHAQIQIALYFIGKQLNFRTWIAQNDKGILYQNKRIGEYEGVIASLKDEQLMIAYDDAVQAALLIDCIWFKNGKLMPAVMEVEHSTGVTSGLSRMKNFKDKFPPFPTRYVIVAPDEDRDKVIKEANKPQFADLDTRYFTYSAVEELYALCQRRKIKGVTEEFLDCYMERVLN